MIMGLDFIQVMTIFTPTCLLSLPFAVLVDIEEVIS